MKLLIYVFIGLILLLVQLTVIELVSIRGAVPNLLVIFLIYFVQVAQRTKTIVFAFLLGVIQDLLTCGVPGVYALAKSVAGFIAGRYIAHHFYQPVLIVFVADLLHNILVLLFLTDKPHMSQLLFMLISSLYTAVIAIVIFSLFPIHEREETEF